MTTIKNANLARHILGHDISPQAVREFNKTLKRHMEWSGGGFVIDLDRSIYRSIPGPVSVYDIVEMRECVRLIFFEYDTCDYLGKYPFVIERKIGNEWTSFGMMIPVGMKLPIGVLS